MPVSRRDFLKSAAVLPVAAPSVFGIALRLSAPKCVIVGAGLAGLAAAWKLKNAGWDVAILEARDRIGGRVFTHRMPENTELHCELGAEWIGENHTRMLALCKEFGLELSDHRFRESLLINGVAKPPGQWNYSEKSAAGFAKFREDFKKYTPENMRRLDRLDWWTHLRTIGFSDQDLRLRDLFDSTDFGETIRGVSAYAAASEYLESCEHNEMDFKIVGGNSRIIDEFVRRIGQDSVHLKTIVTAIEQRKGGVRIVTDAGEFTADACICTVPSRVLGSIRFTPPLPPDQASAAEQLQSGRIVKSHILFSRRFWDREDFALASDLTSHYLFNTTKTQTGTEGILTAYTVGDKADVLASQDLNRRRDMILGDLSDFDRSAPLLANGIASYAWQRDPYTQGAYAIYRPGEWFSLRPVLARPHGRVHFAGEHLADWQGFMEGAVVTGEDAAGAVKKLKT